MSEVALANPVACDPPKAIAFTSGHAAIASHNSRTRLITAGMSRSVFRSLVSFPGSLAGGRFTWSDPSQLWLHSPALRQFASAVWSARIVGPAGSAIYSISIRWLVAESTVVAGSIDQQIATVSVSNHWRRRDSPPTRREWRQGAASRTREWAPRNGCRERRTPEAWPVRYSVWSRTIVKLNACSVFTGTGTMVQLDLRVRGVSDHIRGLI